MDTMTADKNVNSGDFDISAFTAAPLKLDMRIEFQGMSPEDVFEVMGDPERVKDWYLLAKEVHLHEPDADGQVNFFPLKGYVALIEVQQTGADEGVMIWRQYFDEIEGDYNSRIVPVILPPLNEASLERLAPMIGGSNVEMKSYL
jgi:hypothetical protein